MNKAEFKIVKEFSCKVKAIRRERHLSQEQLADLAKVSRATVANLERTEPAYVPSFTNAFRVAKILNISLDNLGS